MSINRTETIREFMGLNPHLIPIMHDGNRVRFEYEGGKPTIGFESNGFIIPNTEDNTIIGTANAETIRRSYELPHVYGDLVLHANLDHLTDAEFEDILEMTECLTEDLVLDPGDYYDELNRALGAAWEWFIDEHDLPDTTEMPELHEGEHYGLSFDGSEVQLWDDMVLPLVR